MHSVKHRNLVLSTIIVLSLIAVACDGTALTALEAVITAAQVAIPALSATGAIPAATATLIVNYLDTVNTAVGQTATELATADTAAQKATKIAGFFATAVKPALPAGTPQNVVSIIQAVDIAITALLTSIGASTPAGGGAPQVVSSPKGLAKVDMSQAAAKQKLDELKQRNSANAQSLQMLQKVLQK